MISLICVNHYKCGAILYNDIFKSSSALFQKLRSRRVNPTGWWRQVGPKIEKWDLKGFVDGFENFVKKFLLLLGVTLEFH